MSRFLRFVVEETLDGNAEAIKEYLIGVEVFDKPDSFDPQTDSTVRSEAVKLRARLARYYESEGRHQPILISIRKGGYVPAFEFREIGLAVESVGITKGAGPDSTTAGPGSIALVVRSLHRYLWAAGVLTILLMSASWLWYAARAMPAPALPIQPVPLTSYPGQELQPTFSPDGNRIAFVWDGDKQDNLDIYVKQIGSEAPVRITNDPGADSDPAWSPDGRLIAFCRLIGPATRGVFIVPSSGGTERQVAESRQPGVFWPQPFITWAPDSRSLVISDVDNPNQVVAPTGFTPGSLFLVSIETGHKRRLTFHPDRAFVDSGPAFSPDGRDLAFVRTNAPPLSDLYVVPLSASLVPTAEPRRLTSWNRFTTSPAWMPDGREIIVAAGHWENVRLWRVPLSLDREPRRLEFAGDHTSHPAVSRQGRLAYSQTVSDVNIWESKFAVKGEQIISQSPLIASTRTDINPQFSPDGKKIVFCSDRSGNIEIWTSDRNGSSAMQVTSMGAAVTGTPRWSPDGTRIVYDSNKEGQFEVYVISATGGEPKRLTNDPSADGAASWSQDGRSIYFMSNRGGARHIWKVPAEGGEPVQVTRRHGWVAMESPDGKYLYFSAPPDDSGRTAASGLWRVPVNGGDETLLLPSVTFLNFALAKGGIYFIPMAEPGVGYSVHFFSFATRRSWPVLGLGDTLSIGLALAPDGHSLLYTRTDEEKTDLMLVEALP
jgi:Tol biopolymer transport system component